MKIYPFEFNEFIDTKNNPLLKKFIAEKALPCIYGYTVDFNKKKVNSLIMVSTIPTCDLTSNNQVIKNILDYIQNNTVVIKHGSYQKEIKIKDLWIKRIKLSNKLKVPIYIVLWNDNVICLINISQINISKVEEISEKDMEGFVEKLSWEEFAQKLGGMKSLKKQTKKLMYVDIPPFEKRLNIYNVSSPGDLDGFEFSDEDKVILYEFSTRNVSCQDLEQHNPNTFMQQDFKRWVAPMILKNQIENSSTNLVIWSPCCRDKIIIWENIELNMDKKILTKQQVRNFSEKENGT